MSINVNFAGRIGKDGEQRYSPDGKAVVNFSVAVDYFQKGEKKTQWTSCSIWGDRAEKLAQYLVKGTMVAVTGTATIREWSKDDKHGVSLDVFVNDLVLCGSKAEQPAQAETDEISF